MLDEATLRRMARRDTLLAALCLTGALLYETQAHQVISLFLLLAFLWPLLGGALPLWLLRQKKPVRGAVCLWHCGLATLTVGFLMRGVLEIYGSRLSFIDLYFPVGGLVAASGMIIGLAALTKHKKEI